MRRLVLLLVCLTTVPAWADTPPVSKSVPLPAVLPAMVPLPTTHFVACDDCGRAGYAWIDGVYKTPREALKAARKMQGVAPGYPMLAHSTELGIQRVRGTVVVLGLFESRADANAWRSRKGSGRVVELGHWPEDTVSEYQYRFSQLVRVEAAAGAPVYKESDIDYKTPRSRLEPLCTLPHDSVYLLRPDDYMMSAQWVPARCPGGKSGYVYKTDTALDTAVVPQKDGTVKLYQITFVECDMASIDEWLWEPRTGRRKPIKGWAYDVEGNASGGCGAY